MKALRFDGKDLTLDEIPIPEGGGALIRVTTSGICNTDIEIVRGYAGFVGTIGHEFIGIVETSDDLPQLIGKRVVGEINAGCGHCEKCLANDPRHCSQRSVLGILGRDGAHAEYLRLPSQNLVVVPDCVTDEQAVFVEPLAAAWGITEQVDLGPQTRVAVIGDGKLGLLCAMAIAQTGAEMTLVGKHLSKMAIAEQVDIKTILLSDIDVAEHKFDVVIEASGSESGFETAVDIVFPRGKIVLKSTFHGKPKWPASRIVVDEISIIGSRCGRFAPALDLLAKGRINVEGMISDKFSLISGVEAMKRATEPGILKVLLTQDQRVPSK